MADEQQAQPAPTVQVITASQTAPADPTTVMQALVDADRTRSLVIKFVFYQFNAFVLLTCGAMVWKGWNIQPTAENVFVMILQAEIAAMTTAVSYYLGSSQGSAMKSMAAALSNGKK